MIILLTICAVFAIQALLYWALPKATAYYLVVGGTVFLISKAALVAVGIVLTIMTYKLIKVNVKLEAREKELQGETIEGECVKT